MADRVSTTVDRMVTQCGLEKAQKEDPLVDSRGSGNKYINFHAFSLLLQASVMPGVTPVVYDCESLRKIAAFYYEAFDACRQNDGEEQPFISCDNCERWHKFHPATYHARDDMDQRGYVSCVPWGYDFEQCSIGGVKRKKATFMKLKKVKKICRRSLHATQKLRTSLSDPITVRESDSSGSRATVRDFKSNYGLLERSLTEATTKVSEIIDDSNSDGDDDVGNDGD